MSKKQQIQRIQRIQEEAAALEINFSSNGHAIDLDKRSGGLGGTFVINGGLDEAEKWLASHRQFIEAKDRDYN